MHPDLVNYASFSLLINTDRVRIIEISDVLVPKIQGENPVIANPTAIWLFNCRDLPTSAAIHKIRVAKFSTNAEILFVSVKLGILSNK